MPNKKLFFVKKVKPTARIKNITKEIIINFESVNNNGKVKFLLEQRVCPWSAFIDVYIAEKEKSDRLLQTLTIYDVWCWRERQSLKEVTDLISLPVKTIKLRQSNKLPNYGQNREKCDFDSHPKHIRPKGEIYSCSEVLSILNLV